jgi:16S rRNA (cytosine967-C5)-methyltransferase
LGIVRRHPDVRWLRRPDDIGALTKIQAELLDALWPLLKPGGRLVYATCSVFRAESQAQADAFLQRHPEALAQTAPGVTGHLLPLAHNGSAVAAPGAGVLDGFFYALILKPLN